LIKRKQLSPINISLWKPDIAQIKITSDKLTS